MGFGVCVCVCVGGGGEEVDRPEEEAHACSHDDGRIVGKKGGWSVPIDPRARPEKGQFNHSISKSMNQSVNQSINQPINHRTRQTLTGVEANQPTNHRTRQTLNQSTIAHARQTLTGMEAEVLIADEDLGDGRDPRQGLRQEHLPRLCVSSWVFCWWCVKWKG